MTNRESDIDPTKDPTSTKRNCGAFYDLTLGNAESTPSKWNPRSAIWRIWYPLDAGGRNAIRWPLLRFLDPPSSASRASLQLIIAPRLIDSGPGHVRICQSGNDSVRACHSGNPGECQFIGQLGDDLGWILVHSRIKEMYLKVIKHDIADNPFSTSHLWTLCKQ